VVVPTQNAGDNLYELLQRIRRSLQPLDYTFEVVIADDATLGDAREGALLHAATYPLRIIESPRGKGLAKSTLNGIKASTYDLIVVVSADLRAAEKIPELISRVQNGADIAIGSRYVKRDPSDGSSFLRRIAHAGADLFARTLFREIRNVTDVGSGFFAIRKDVVTRAKLNPAGNNILLEILVKGDYGSVAEVTYEPSERDAAIHKGERRDTAYDLRHLSSLFWRSGEFHRFLKFCVVGSVGAVFNLVVLYSLTELGVFYLLSGLVGIEAGLLSNFFLNRSWTFKDRGTRGLGSVLTALYRDHAVRFVGIVLNLVILWILTSVFGLYYLASQVIGIAVAMLWNYGGNQWWTWETA
jgi:dolichol-phosphate mannosyltransferase